MTIKLVQGINQIDVRLKQKSANNTYLFILKNKNTKYEYEYNAVDLNTLSIFARFVLDITNIEYGEYVYSIIDGNNIICRDGLAYFSYPSSTIPTYEENNKYITYGGQ